MKLHATNSVVQTYYITWIFALNRKCQWAEKDSCNPPDVNQFEAKSQGNLHKNRSHFLSAVHKNITNTIIVKWESSIINSEAKSNVVASILNDTKSVWTANCPQYFHKVRSAATVCLDCHRSYRLPVACPFVWSRRTCRQCCQRRKAMHIRQILAIQQRPRTG